MSSSVAMESPDPQLVRVELNTGAEACHPRPVTRRESDMAAEPILETERLVFHPFTPDDLPLLRDLHSDPEVQRYIGGMWEAEVLQRRLDQYVTDQAARGISKWKAYLKDGTFVGRAGVSWWAQHEA